VAAMLMLFNRYLISGEPIDKQKPIFKSLNWFDLCNLIMSEAVFTGTVVDRQYIRDSTKCLWFGIKNVYRVEEVLHSYFPLKKGSYLLESRTGGYSGACTPSGQEEIFTYETHQESYSVGNKALFVASSQGYARFFMGRRYLTGNFNDEYCPNMFTMLTNSNSWNHEKTKDMKQFCKQNF